MRISNWLSNRLTEQINEDQDTLFADTNFATTISYLRFTTGAATAVDDDTGLVTTTPYTTTLSVPAYVGAFKTAEDVSFEKVVDHADLKCLFRRASVTGPYSTKDIIAWKGDNYRVYEIQTVALGSASTRPDLVLCLMRRMGKSQNP